MLNTDHHPLASSIQQQRHYSGTTKDEHRQEESSGYFCHLPGTGTCRTARMLKKKEFRSPTSVAFDRPSSLLC